MFSVFFVLTIIALKWIVKPKAPEKSTAIQMQHENIAKTPKKNFCTIIMSGFAKKQKKHQTERFCCKLFSQ